MESRKEISNWQAAGNLLAMFLFIWLIVTPAVRTYILVDQAMKRCFEIKTAEQYCGLVAVPTQKAAE